jgi:hypothetical protein
MHQTAIDRRELLAGLLSFAGTAAFGSRVSAELAEELYAAARKDAGGGYSAAIFNSLGTELNAVALPGRGHDICVCPVSRRCVAFARRPGNFAVVFSPSRSELPVWFTTPADRHFYGHGIFSPDGRLLFATENDFDGERGILGIYDATGGFKRIGEFSTFGIGPHDLSLLADGSTLVIANGGIATHPDFDEGRMPLNLAEMEPSLVYLDLRNGELIERHVLPRELHQISLRHLDVGANDRIAIGCQSDHVDRIDLPLIFSHRRGEDFKTIQIEQTISKAMRGYISSVAIDRSGEIAALTSSHGGRVIFVEVASGKMLAKEQIPDVSGVAPAGAPGQFLLTTGLGKIMPGATPAAVTASTETGFQWDNHAVRL